MEKEYSKWIQGEFESKAETGEETVFDLHNGPVDCDHFLLVLEKVRDVHSHTS